LDAVLQAEGFATPTYKARQRLRVVEVCNEVEGVTDWAFDERDEVISHDDLLRLLIGQRMKHRKRLALAVSGRNLPKII
jgi:hypothetical protein